MAIRVVSDLHPEAPRVCDMFEIAPRAPCLALLGELPPRALRPGKPRGLPFQLTHHPRDSSRLRNRGFRRGRHRPFALSPSRDSRTIGPRHAQSPITTSGFATDLSDEPCFRSGKVKLWAFGHAHYNCDFTDQREGAAEPLGLLANQRGYYFAQALAYDGEKTVEI